VADLPEEHRLGPRFTDALAYAADVHVGQARKVADEDEPTIPYLGHLLAVAGEVVDSGGDEDEAIAALLHDAVEDQGGREQLAVIRERFGEKVAKIVEDCSDTLESENKEEWGERKRRYITKVVEEGDFSSLHVSVADKLQNVRSIIRDHGRVGDEVWERFNRPKAFTLGYHTALRDAYRERAQELGVDLPLLEPYSRAIDELAEIAGVDPEPLMPKPA
jgi:(p)ppGpp synthase/HD superfamily hydrolase